MEEIGGAAGNGHREPLRCRREVSVKGNNAKRKKEKEKKKTERELIWDLEENERFF